MMINALCGNGDDVDGVGIWQSEGIRGLLLT